MGLVGDTAASIGWHDHASGPVWGIKSDDGCALCDLADAWLMSQPTHQDRLRSVLGITKKPTTLKLIRGEKKPEPKGTKAERDQGKLF